MGKGSKACLEHHVTAVPNSNDRTKLGLTDERLSYLAVLHTYKYKDDDIGGIVTEFAHLKGTHFAPRLWLSPLACDSRPLLVTSLITSLLYPFFHKHCTLLIPLKMGKIKINN